MDWFKFVKEHYNLGNYTKEQVSGFVIKNKITAEQYKEITGDTYNA